MKKIIILLFIFLLSACYDYNEIEEVHTIVKCIIDGTNPDKLICIVD